MQIKNRSEKSGFFYYNLKIIQDKKVKVKKTAPCAE
jgi:hypothetical protein